VAGEPLVEVEHGVPVAVLRLNRPKQLNALSVALVDELTERLAELDHDERVGAVVLVGNGRSFSAGGDLGDIAERVGNDETYAPLRLMSSLQRLVTAIRDSRLPIVAAPHGHVYGAGWSLVLACDLVVAAADAVFCQVFTRRDLVPDLGSAWLLTRALGAPRARELMLTGEELSATEAFGLGLLNGVEANADEALTAAVDLARRASGASVATVGMTKSLIAASEQLSFEEALRLERHAQSLALGSPASKAAIAAFREARPAS
jgi:2-(1,2-epoxy-1,2-dihydrophenyl)acetyl-CoA isomerase